MDYEKCYKCKYSKRCQKAFTDASLICLKCKATARELKLRTKRITHKFNTVIHQAVFNSSKQSKFKWQDAKRVGIEKPIE